MDTATYPAFGSARQVFTVGALRFGVVICHEGWRYPETVRWAFYIGGAALMAAVAWTVFSTKEYSPQELARFEAASGRVSGGRAAAEARRERVARMGWRSES